MARWRAGGRAGGWAGASSNCGTRAQLRNPLHAMMGALSIVESGALSIDAETRVQVSTLRHGVDVMCALTSDILDIHSLSTGRLRLAEAWTNLRELLEGCVAHSMRPSAHILALDDSVPALVFIDPLRVRQVVMNGLTNAVKYSQEGAAAEVHVSARMTAAGGLVIEVLDRGRGLRGRTLEELGREFAELPSREIAAAAAEAYGPSAFNKVRPHE